MGYRTITVEGKRYEYMIGRSNVKFRGGLVVPISDVGFDYEFLDPNVRVTPKHIRAYIIRTQSDTQP